MFTVETLPHKHYRFEVPYLLLRDINNQTSYLSKSAKVLSENVAGLTTLLQIHWSAF